MTEPIGTNEQRITPYIAVNDGAAALDWYRDALGAIERVRYVGDDGRVGHAQFTVGGAAVMLSDAYPEVGIVAATTQTGSSHTLHLQVDDCDAMFESAVAHGATVVSEPADQPYGDRQCTIIDPFGHRWMLGQPVSTRSVAEIAEAMEGFTVVEPD